MSSRRWLVLILTLASAGCAPSPASRLTGEWDVYIALSAKPKFGFEGWRRMAFAHFAGPDSNSVGFLKRRTGQSMLDVKQVTMNGDSVILSQDSSTVVRAAWHGDTLVGLQYTGGKLQDRRLRLVRRSTPGAAEPDYQVWTKIGRAHV